MIDKESREYKAAEDRVKISHFTQQGYEITGLVHVGANDGYEIQYYLAMGIKPVLAIEPLSSARKIAFQKYFSHPDVILAGCGLGNFDGWAPLHITDGDGKGSSFLWEKGPPQVVMVADVEMHRWSSINRQDIDRSKFNCCVIDVQGMELDVLRGMDDQIKQFSFLSVECSEVPIYKGEASASEVIAYLHRMGFERDSPIAAHDDIMFINRDVKHPPQPPLPIPTGSQLNIGSGQRRFDTAQGWINVDCVSRPGQVPDLLCDAGKESLPYPDESMDRVVLHQVYEHFGLGEGHALIREAKRVLKHGGSLIITVPNMPALAKRWLAGDLSNYLYFVNVYGAYQGEPGDRHKWGYSPDELIDDMVRASKDWARIEIFDFRTIPGADIAQDWWILGVECWK